MNRSRSLTTAGSLNSTMSLSASMPELPNLPGVKRDVSLINPKLYKQFKASTKSLEDYEEEPQLREEENSLYSYFENSEKLAKSISPYPSATSSFNDINGRYSLISQKRDRENKSRALPFSKLDAAPPFVQNKKQVCSFIGFFDEFVDGNLDRSRKVEIKFYLEDDTIEINEPKVENSGTTSGKFLKRHKIYKPNDQKSFFTLADFYSGAEVNIYNRTYYIVDCDNYTRKYLEQIGKPFGSPLTLPNTLYDPSTRSGMSRASSTSKASLNARSHPKLGFFKYDRKVLRFYGVWDSRSKLFGDEIYVKLHYTLADDTIEIVPYSSTVSGRGKMPKLLKKSLIMKKPSSDESNYSPDASRVNTGNSMDKSSQMHRPDFQKSLSVDSLINDGSDELVPSRPYHWTDLRIGETVSVASLSVLLIDADEFTREFYNSKDMPLDPPIQLPEPEFPKLQTTIPPYNGFGSEEDSLQTCKHSLIPTAPMKDGLKAKLFQGLVLSYSATLHNPKEADKSRKFVIQYFLEDDTVQIREPPIRNSGHKGGIFLSRCKLETHDESEPLRPQDIFLGSTISIHTHKFDIHDCDQFTFKYMEANPSLWKYSDISYVNQKLKSKKEVIQKIILRSPALGNKNIDVEGLNNILLESGLVLTRQETWTTFRAIDTYRNGSIRLTKFLRYLMDL